jgi:hypothetical protein
VALLLLLGVSFAQVVEADIVEEKDSGAESLPALEAALWVDCESGNATLTLGSNGSRVEGATVFLFRTDSAYKLLARSSTDKEGVSTVRPPGKISYLNDLYVLRIEKSGFRTKEAEFTFWNCEDVVREYSEYSRPEEKPEPPAASKETAPVAGNESTSAKENTVPKPSGQTPEPLPLPDAAESVPSSTCIALPGLLLAAFGYLAQGSGKSIRLNT